MMLFLTPITTARPLPSHKPQAVFYLVERDGGQGLGEYFQFVPIEKACPPHSSPTEKLLFLGILSTCCKDRQFVSDVIVHPSRIISFPVMAEAAPAAAATTEPKAKKVTLQKPDKAKLQRETDAIQAEITALQAESKAYKAKIEKINSDRDGSKGESDAARSVMQALNADKKQLMNERNALQQSRDAARDKINAKMNTEKAMRTELKFSSVESIDSQIRELETRQARTTMSLNDEKKIIKDIKALQMSKKTVLELKQMKEAIDQLKVEKAAIDKACAEKTQELKVLGERITAQRAVLDNLNKDNAETRDAVPALRNKMTELREKSNEKYQQMKAMRASFKAQEEAYYAQLAEEKARKKEAYLKEKAERAAQEEARRKEL